MLGWIERLINQLGYWGIAALMALENVVPPIPSEAIMPLAGFVASRGELSFAGVVLAGTIGSVLGSLPLYYLGRWVGPERLKRWAGRHGKWVLVSEADLDRVFAWFQRRGTTAVLLGRLVPGVRSLISIPAGVSGMPLGIFLVYTTLGTGIWAALLATAGRVLGKNYARVEALIGPVGYVVLGALLIWIVIRMLKAKTSPERAE